MFSWAGATYHRCKSFIFSVLGRIGDLAAVFSIRSGAGAGLDSKNSIFEIGPFPPNTLVNIELASIFGPFFLGSLFPIAWTCSVARVADRVPRRMISASTFFAS